MGRSVRRGSPSPKRSQPSRVVPGLVLRSNGGALARNRSSVVRHAPTKRPGNRVAHGADHGLQKGLRSRGLFRVVFMTAPCKIAADALDGGIGDIGPSRCVNRRAQLVNLHSAQSGRIQRWKITDSKLPAHVLNPLLRETMATLPGRPQDDRHAAEWSVDRPIRASRA